MTRGQPAPPADADGRRSMKVIALGAPVSVQIRFEPCEAAVVVDELRAQIIAYETAEADARVGIGGSPPGDEGRRDRLGELRQMLGEIESDSELPAEPFEVLWPAALAIDVLRGALYEAAERLHTSLNDLKSTVAIRSALGIVAACLDTLESFDAVDSGGLQDVWL
jgi:hypothetical protein